VACPEFEDLLSGRCEEHLLHCERCRALLEAHAEVDHVFEKAFKGITAPESIVSTVLARIRPGAKKIPKRPSPVPEFLDLIGWAAVLASVAIVLPQLTSFFRSFWPGL
jgi:predicted anti-sigma-YlaC factor YlaD